MRRKYMRWKEALKMGHRGSIEDRQLLASRGVRLPELSRKRCSMGVALVQRECAVGMEYGFQAAIVVGQQRRGHTVV
jgi:hypothetical protein